MKNKRRWIIRIKCKAKKENDSKRAAKGTSKNNEGSLGKYTLSYENSKPQRDQVNTPKAASRRHNTHISSVDGEHFFDTLERKTQVTEVSHTCGSPIHTHSITTTHCRKLRRHGMYCYLSPRADRRRLLSSPSDPAMIPGTAKELHLINTTASSCFF